MTVLGMFVLFLVLLFLGMPVAFAMGIAGCITLFSMGDIPLTLIPQRLFVSVNSFPLMAVPFFIIAGITMNLGGITKRLVNFSSALVGHLAGGLAQVNVVTSMLFAGISGSASADASAIGSMLIPAMKKDGYDASFSVAVTACGATIGPIIPPSIVMVIYGSMTNLSIGALFAGGIIPGILIGLALMVVVKIYADKRGYKRGERVPFSEVVKRGKEAIWALIAPIIILGGILTGVFTATEAGAVAAVYAFIVGIFIYKEIKLKDFKELFLESTVMTSSPILILGMASIFGWILAREQFSIMLVNILGGITDNSHILYFLVVVMLLLVGLVIEALAAMIIFVPALAPIAVQFGWDPIHFALVVIIAMLIGTVTPPVGLQLYIAAAIGKVPISKVKEIWPFVGAMVVILLLVVYIPGLVTFIPDLLFK